MVVDMDKLTVAERIQLVQDVWDSIARDPASVPIPEEQLALLDARLEEYRRNPREGLPWKALKERILKSR